MSEGTGPSPQLSVVLPTYNEAETIVEVIDAVLEQIGDNGEVIVVDDDSPDLTWSVVRKFYPDDDRVYVIRRMADSGLSSAILAGIRNSRGEFVVVMDADGQHPPERILDLVAPIASGEAVLSVGSRHVDAGEIEGWSNRRKVISKAGTLVAQGFVPPSRKVSDPMSGFFAIHRRSFLSVLEDADPHGYKILLELLALFPDAEVAEVPITFRDREAGESKLSIDEQLHFLEHVIGLWFLSIGLDSRVSTPLFIRSLEAAAVVAVAIAIAFIGIVEAQVQSAFGAGLLALSGGWIVLGMQRVWSTGESWSGGGVA